MGKEKNTQVIVATLQKYQPTKMKENQSEGKVKKTLP